RGADGPLVPGDAALRVGEPAPVGGEGRDRALRVHVRPRTVVHRAQGGRGGVDLHAVGGDGGGGPGPVRGADGDVVDGAAGEREAGVGSGRRRPTVGKPLPVRAPGAGADGPLVARHATLPVREAAPAGVEPVQRRLEVDVGAGRAVHYGP